MNKYVKLFKVSMAQEFAYRASFVLWRVRNIFQIFLIFFLWDSVFANPDKVVFGYNRDQILTYVFGLFIVRAIVLSSRAIEISGEVARGDISNLLIKPVNYFSYWLTRDLSSKTLNLGFAFFEVFILFLILKPPFFIQTNIFSIFGFLVSLSLAVLIFFVLLLISGSIPFWYPEAAWGVNFLFISIFVEFLSGAIFPIDILPNIFQEILALTPFPYLVFFPLKVYLGQIYGLELVRGILVSAVWLVLLWVLMKNVWGRGLKVYQSHGR